MRGVVAVGSSNVSSAASAKNRRFLLGGSSEPAKSILSEVGRHWEHERTAWTHANGPRSRRLSVVCAGRRDGRETANFGVATIR